MDIGSERRAQDFGILCLNKIITWSVAAGISAGAWWALFGWDPRGGSSAWQFIAGLALLGLLSVWFGHRRSVLVAPGVAACAVGLSGSVTLASPDPYADAWTVLAAGFLGIYVFCISVVVAAITWGIEDTVRRGRRAAAPRSDHQRIDGNRAAR